MKAHGAGGAKDPRQGGFTLLEVLVALAVAAAFLGAMLPLLTQLRERTQREARMLDAVALAEVQMAQLSVWPARLPTPAQGQRDGLAWAVLEESAKVAPEPGAMVLRRFRIRVTEARDGAVMLDLPFEQLGRDE